METETEEEKKMNEDFQELKFIGLETEEKITLDDGRVVSQITVEEFKDHPRTLFFRPMTKEDYEQVESNDKPDTKRTD